MTLPFTIEEFLKVFQGYNTAIWPAQILAVAIGLIILAALLVSRNASLNVVMASLGVMWAFTSIGNHLMFFGLHQSAGPGVCRLLRRSGCPVCSGRDQAPRRPSPISGTDRAMGHGSSSHRLCDDVLSDPRDLGGSKRDSHADVLGAPCPTTIISLGILIMTHDRWDVGLSNIPVLWWPIGLAAALQSGILEDPGVPFAGAVLIEVPATLHVLDAKSGPETIPMRRAQ